MSQYVATALSVHQTQGCLQILALLDKIRLNIKDMNGAYSSIQYFDVLNVCMSPMSPATTIRLFRLAPFRSDLGDGRGSEKIHSDPPSTNTSVELKLSSKDPPVTKKT